MKAFNNFLTIALLLLILSCVNSPSTLKMSNPYNEKAKVQDVDLGLDKGKLTGTLTTLDVSYDLISCPCPKWVRTSVLKDTITEKEHFYLEPANLNIVNADTLFDGENLPVRVQVKGQFYKKIGYPENYQSTKGSPSPAKVFRYHEIEVISR